MICPHCKKEIPREEIAKHFASMGGSVKSEAKAIAARLNAQKPRKKKKKLSTQPKRTMKGKR